MDKNKIVRVIGLSLATCAILVTVFLFGIIGMFMAASISSSLIFHIAAGVLYVEMIVVIFIAIRNRKLLVKAKKIFILVGAGAIAVCIALPIYQYYLDHIPTVEEGEYAVDLEAYQPYEGSQVAALNEKSTLLLAENLPRIDCATALYPVASAFAQSTYSKKKYEAGTTDGEGLIRFMNGKKLMDAPTETVVSAMDGMIEEVSDYKNFKNAIGYSFRFYCTGMVADNQIRLLKLNGVYPDKKTIRNSAYPMSAEFYAITADTENPNVNRFIDWILSPQGQYLIEKTGYVGLDKNLFR